MLNYVPGYVPKKFAIFFRRNGHNQIQLCHDNNQETDKIGQTAHASQQEWPKPRLYQQCLWKVTHFCSEIGHSTHRPVLFWKSELISLNNKLIETITKIPIKPSDWHAPSPCTVLNDISLHIQLTSLHKSIATMPNSPSIGNMFIKITCNQLKLALAHIYITQYFHIYTSGNSLRCKFHTLPSELV